MSKNRFKVYMYISQHKMETDVAVINNVRVISRKHDIDTTILFFYQNDRLLNEIPNGFKLKLCLEGGGLCEPDSHVQSLMPFYVLYNRRSYVLEYNGQLCVKFTFTPGHIIEAVLV